MKPVNEEKLVTIYDECSTKDKSIFFGVTDLEFVQPTIVWSMEGQKYQKTKMEV